MEATEAIRAAMVLRKWCIGRSCVDCPFCIEGVDGCHLTIRSTPSKWPVMSFDDEEGKR